MQWPLAARRRDCDTLSHAECPALPHTAAVLESQKGVTLKIFVSFSRRIGERIVVKFRP